MEYSKTIKYLKSLTDSQGIIQFSRGKEKDDENGYAIEDQARALIVASKLHDESLANIYVHNILKTKHENGVRMLWNMDGTFLPKTDDFNEASAEVVWGLGQYYAWKPEEKDTQFLDHLIEGIKHSPHLRVHAYTLLGLIQLHDERVKQFADKIIWYYSQNSSSDWKWFERTLYYANAILPWSLFESYKLVKDTLYLQVAQETFDFLLTVSKHNNVPIAIGNKGWWTKGNEIPLYDQQPIDIAYTVLACLSAYDVTQDTKYLDQAKSYFSWFEGNNLQHISMIRDDGGCYDGLNENGVNQNSGAESTVCYLLAGLCLKEYLT